MKYNRIIGYTRSSIVYKGKSKEDKEKPLEDIKHEFQKEKIKEFAGEKTCILFSESDIPRDTPIQKCPALTKALECLKKDDVLVFYRLDRLLAGTHKLNEITTLVGKRRADILSLTETDIFRDDPQAKFSLTIRAAAAELEIELLRNRVKEKLEYKKKMGLRTGRIPYGYRLEGNSQIVKDEKEMKNLQLMINLRNFHKKTYKEIADELNILGIRKRSGLDWDQSAVFRILRNIENHAKSFPEHLQLTIPQRSQFQPSASLNNV